MEHLAAFAAWESFYVIVGSSAAALTGLQFVVIVLGAEVKAVTSNTTQAFGTPTVVHFCAVLLTSAILSAPWHSEVPAAVCLGLGGVGGLVYTLQVMVVVRRQSDYTPVLEDWLGHVVIPAIAYLAFVAAAIALRSHTETSLFVIGGASTLLLFDGIHNAWDAVTYIAHRPRPDAE